jgi:hypothetical protein
VWLRSGVGDGGSGNFLGSRWSFCAAPVRLRRGGAMESRRHGGSAPAQSGGTAEWGGAAAARFKGGRRGGDRVPGGAGWAFKKAPGILGGAPVVIPAGIAVTRRGSCAARKVELTGGPGWQREESGAQASALCGRAAYCGCQVGLSSEERRAAARRVSAGPRGCAGKSGAHTGVLGRRLGRAGKRAEQREAGLGQAWVWLLLGLRFAGFSPFLFLFTLSLLFLIQTKFEFKYKFEFKPHSNN